MVFSISGGPPIPPGPDRLLPGGPAPRLPELAATLTSNLFRSGRASGGSPPWPGGAGSPLVPGTAPPPFAGNPRVPAGLPPAAVGQGGAGPLPVATPAANPSNASPGPGGMVTGHAVGLAGAAVRTLAGQAAGPHTPAQATAQAASLAPGQALAGVPVPGPTAPGHLVPGQSSPGPVSQGQAQAGWPLGAAVPQARAAPGQAPVAAPVMPNAPGAPATTAVPHAVAGARADAAAVPVATASATATTLAGGQAPVPPGQATLATRAEGGLVADRAAAVTMPGNPAAPGVAASTPAATMAPAAQAAPGNPQATSPATANAVPATQAGGEARGNTVMASSDRGAARTDGPLPHGHTVEASQRRRGSAARGLGTAVLAALAGGRPGDLEIEVRRQADDVFRWLYWALTLTAWLCVVLLVAAVLPALNATGPAATPWAAAPLRFAGLAGLGLLAGAAAWLMARRRRN